MNLPQTVPYAKIQAKQTTFLLLILLLIGLIAVSVIGALCLGTVGISRQETFSILTYQLLGVDIFHNISQIPQSHMDIIWELRLPRVLMAVVAGSGLALSGAVMQASVQNPLAEPYILGIASGASLGATVSILFGGSASAFFGFGTAFWAFAGALGASALVLTLSGLSGQMSTVKMVLAGAITNALFSSIANFIVYIANDAEGMRSVAFWTMGSLAAANWDNLLLPAASVGVCAIFFLCQSRILNTLLLGEEAAITLGVDLTKVRRLYMAFTALLTGIIVSACGIFGFVGLVIPHVVRGLVGADHRRLMPVVLLVGAIFLIWADVLARTVLKSGDLPIGIITSIIGAPFFMYILFKQSFQFGSR